MLFSSGTQCVIALRSSEGDPSQSLKPSTHTCTLGSSTGYVMVLQIEITNHAEETGEILPHLKCFHKRQCTKALGSGITAQAGPDPHTH